MIFVESPQCTRAITELMDDDGYRLLQAVLLENPEAGAIIVGSGGLRKVRWALPGRGKRGGARVIYFYHNADLPLFLLTAFAKNVREDISQAARNDFRRLTGLLVENYGRRNV